MKTKRKRSLKLPVFVCAVPSLIGLAVFWLIPFIISLKYSLTDASSGSGFAGLDNFLDVLSSAAFRRGAVNTVIFTVLSCLLEFLLSLFLALGIRKLKKGRGITLALLMIPMAIPSVSISFFWDLLFSENGFLRLLLYRLGYPEINLSSGPVTMAFILIMFIWRYTGFSASIMYSGLIQIPKNYYEAAQIEGAGRLRQLFSITLVYIRPSIVLVTIITFINSFKIYREIYLLYGAYPSSSVYMLQNYMNNLYESGNMIRLSASAWIILISLMVPIMLTLYLQNRFSRETY